MVVILETKNMTIKWDLANKKYYESKGYVFTKLKDVFDIKIEDLSDGSQRLVDVECDCCKEPLKPMSWQNYKKYIHEDGKYFCKICVKKLFSIKKYKETRLKNGISFEKWCLENNKEYLIDLWDYNLNTLLPSEVTYRSGEKFYFKCARGIHKSELNKICQLTNSQEMCCRQCNSFAQWGVDNICVDFLNKYWDYDKNTIDPWTIDKGSSKKKVWIICQEKDYHDSYKINCNDFINNCRCPYCNNRGKVQVHKLDSLGTLYPKSIILWSDKNEKSAFEYSPSCKTNVWWKCPENKHKDYKRKIGESKSRDFCCPECHHSKGEERIKLYLTKNNWEQIIQKEYEKLTIKCKNCFNYYISQKKFQELIGLGNGLLSYDFYLPKYNLLIEYQGEYHDGTVNNQTKKQFEKQKEHDRRKKEYAEQKGYNFLEIWYWDFDNIETILEKEICKYK